MKRFLVLCLLLLAPYLSYSEVVLTDEQAVELEQTLDQLDQTLKEQETTIDELKTQCEEQEKTINEAKSSYRKQSIFSILRSILIAIGSCGVGLLIGLLL